MREFNITGSCVPHMHYMVDITNELIEIEKLVDGGKYFTINRARQYGKTTTLSQLYQILKEKYLVLDTSFEGLGDKAFESDKDFCFTFVDLIQTRLEHNNVDKNLIDDWSKDIEKLDRLEFLSKRITSLVKAMPKDIVLLIDEVDKSSNNQLFLHFLGMLRNKYLDRQKGYDKTFKAVILAGVYDVKNLKLKLQPNEEIKFNSPWNIATEFEVEMSFNSKKISTMLIEYEKDYKTGMDIDKISEEIYSFTSGYPFLVSKICKIIHEKLNKNWNFKGIEDAVKIILDEKNTLFDDLIKNLENNKEIYNSVFSIVVEGKKLTYNSDAYEKEIMFGILAKNINNSLKIHNKIFEIRIYNYIIAKREKEQGELLTYEYRTKFIINNKLDMPLILNKFQEVMHDEFREKDSKFLEREGRLLFLCFLKPIINGAGFYYVESETRMDNRMDVIVTYGDEEHIIELKIWHGDNYEQNALQQLSGYLESKRKDIGYLVSFNFNKNKEYKKEWKKCNEKDIYAIVV